MSLSWKDFQGVNAAAALELYDRFRDNPASVDEATRAFFERVPPPPEVRATVAAHLAPAAPAGDARSGVSTFAHPRVSAPDTSGVNQAPSLMETTPGAMRSVTRAGNRVTPRLLKTRTI